MATVTFNLKDKNSKKTPILAVLRWKNNRVRLKTKISIKPKEWNFNRQEVNSKIPTALRNEYNIRLRNIESIALTEYQNYLNREKTEPSPDYLKNTIYKKLYGIEDENKITLPTTFIDYFKYFIDQKSKSINKTTKKPISRATINSYNQTLEKLRNFQSYSDIDITNFNNLIESFYNDFVKYLKSKKFKENTIGKHIKNVRSVLNDAFIMGVHDNQRFKKYFIVLAEETTQIYLSFEELELINNYETKTESEELIKDQFLILCYTGQRFSDLDKILKNYDPKINKVRLNQKKGAKKVSIPIIPELRQILDKYKDRKLKILSNAGLNKKIKTLCSNIKELHEKVEVNYTKGGVKITKWQPKYQLIGTHTGRRSFATNFFKDGYPVDLIMSVTNHKKRSDFFRYIRETDDEKVERFLNRHHSKKIKRI